MSTDARTRAMRYYAGSSRKLEEDVAALSSNEQGVVLLSPRLVVLMRPVHSAHPERWLQLAAGEAQADAWYVHLLVGDLTLALRLAHTLPFLPWLCFQRGARSCAVHRISWARVLRHSRAFAPLLHS